MSNDDDFVHDFSSARRGAAVSSRGKTRVTMYLDDDVLEHFRDRASQKGRGYQTEINARLRQTMTNDQGAGSALRDPIASHVYVTGSFKVISASKVGKRGTEVARTSVKSAREAHSFRGGYGSIALIRLGL